MFNYIKSELYRITHSFAPYLMMLVFAAIPLLFNIMLLILSAPDFPYSTTSFSYSNVVSNPMLFCMAALFLVFTLYEGNNRNGTLKNVIASGISREKMFAGQFIVCLIISIATLTITITVYILSATLLLENKGPVQSIDLIKETFAVFPIAVAALTLSITAVLLFKKIFAGIICWFLILYYIPQILFYIGFKVEPIKKIAMWMPCNFFDGMEVNLSVCSPIWNTPKGLEKCLISGFIGIAVFSALGIFALRKKEL